MGAARSRTAPDDQSPSADDPESSPGRTNHPTSAGSASSNLLGRSRRERTRGSPVTHPLTNHAHIPEEVRLMPASSAPATPPSTRPSQIPTVTGRGSVASRGYRPPAQGGRRLCPQAHHVGPPTRWRKWLPESHLAPWTRRSFAFSSRPANSAEAARGRPLPPPLRTCLRPQYAICGARQRYVRHGHHRPRQPIPRSIQSAQRPSSRSRRDPGPRKAKAMPEGHLCRPAERLDEVTPPGVTESPRRGGVVPPRTDPLS